MLACSVLLFVFWSSLGTVASYVLTSISRGRIRKIKRTEGRFCKGIFVAVVKRVLCV